MLFCNTGVDSEADIEGVTPHLLHVYALPTCGGVFCCDWESSLV